MKLLRFVITLAYAGVIFYLSSRTWDGVPLFPGADKIIHTMIYAGLGFLCVWSLRITSLKTRAQIFPIAAIIAFIYGITDEIHQLFVAGRSCELSDLLSDATGAVLGSWIAVTLAKRIRRQQET
jgi:VanZ family protein